MDAAMIRLAGVSKTYNPRQPGEVRALFPVDLDIPRGSFTVLVGGNGSGKSTLLNLIAGSLRPSTGQVWIDGHEVSALAEYRRARWIARVFQNPLAGTAASLSIVDNFRLAALRTRAKGLRIGVTATFRARVRERVASLGLGLEDKLDRAMGTLSGGQRQALTLVMAVMDHTDILLLDEPTAALDPGAATVVLDTACQLIARHGLTAIMVTHNLQHALHSGNRLIHMAGGRVVHDLEGAEKAALAPEALQQWFASSR